MESTWTLFSPVTASSRWSFFFYKFRTLGQDYGKRFYPYKCLKIWNLQYLMRYLD